jgi:hypothetical protein
MSCCGLPSINLLAAAAVAAEIADRLSKGQEVGSLFETTPDASEYQLYQRRSSARRRKPTQSEGRKRCRRRAQAGERRQPLTRNGPLTF